MILLNESMLKFLREKIYYINNKKYKLKKLALKYKLFKKIYIFDP